MSHSSGGEKRPAAASLSGHHPQSPQASPVQPPLPTQLAVRSNTPGQLWVSQEPSRAPASRRRHWHSMETQLRAQPCCDASPCATWSHILPVPQAGPLQIGVISSLLSLSLVSG